MPKEEEGGILKDTIDDVGKKYLMDKDNKLQKIKDCEKRAGVTLILCKDKNAKLPSHDQLTEDYYSKKIYSKQEFEELHALIWQTHKKELKERGFEVVEW